MLRRRISFSVTANFSPRVFKRTVSLGLARALLVLVGIAALLVVAALALAGSGAYRVVRLRMLERRNAELETEFTRVSELRGRLEQLEDQNRRMAEMLGVDLTPPPVDWSMVPFDSSELPAWATGDEWGSIPLPSLMPVDRYVVSRGFDTTHRGIDLAAQSGAPVRASADAIVVGHGFDSVFGNYVLLRHMQGYETYYGHLQRTRVAIQDTIRAGQAIGTVGSSGRSSAPHLHFEVIDNGRHVDPTIIFRL
ncbi:MAG: M23 family metallopeptidase [candidate division WOR-3 bacterium]|nr:MAG: M23 family metallopeptidase [candidate division WOR-3 bacterium]